LSVKAHAKSSASEPTKTAARLPPFAAGQVQNLCVKSA